MVLFKHRLRLKDSLKQRLLRAGGLGRLHIVGCSRSGTTMLHDARAAFQNAVLHDEETAPSSYPGLKEAWSLYCEGARVPGPRFLVTKRVWGWFKPEALEELARYVRRYDVCLVNIVRDPRDVLTSRHKWHRDRYYVEPEFWQASMQATRWLLDELADHRLKLTVRFEDLILAPDTLQQQLCALVPLRLRDNVASLGALKDNLESSRQHEGNMVDYLNDLRNFDPEAIGRWRNDPTSVERVQQLLDSPQGDEIRAFMRAHGYEDDPTAGA